MDKIETRDMIAKKIKRATGFNFDEEEGSFMEFKIGDRFSLTEREIEAIKNFYGYETYRISTSQECSFVLRDRSDDDG